MNNLLSLYSQNPYSYLLTEEEYKPIDSLKNAKNTPAAKDVISQVDQQTYGDASIANPDISTVIKLAQEYQKAKKHATWLLGKIDLVTQTIGKNLNEVSKARESLQILLGKPGDAKPTEYKEVEMRLKKALDVATEKSNIPADIMEMWVRLTQKADEAVNNMHALAKRLINLPTVPEVLKTLYNDATDRDAVALRDARLIQLELKADAATRSAQDAAVRAEAKRRSDRQSANSVAERPYRFEYGTKEITNSNEVNTETEAIEYARGLFLKQNTNADDEDFMGFIRTVYEYLYNHKFEAATKLWGDKLGPDTLGFRQSQVLNQNGRFVNRKNIKNANAKTFMLCMLWTAKQNSAQRAKKEKAKIKQIVKQTGMPVIQPRDFIRSVDQTTKNESVFQTFLDFITEENKNTEYTPQYTRMIDFITKTAEKAIATNKKPKLEGEFLNIIKMSNRPNALMYLDELVKIVNTFTSSNTNTNEIQNALNRLHSLQKIIAPDIPINNSKTAPDTNNEPGKTNLPKSDKRYQAIRKTAKGAIESNSYPEREELFGDIIHLIDHPQCYNYLDELEEITATLATSNDNTKVKEAISRFRGIQNTVNRYYITANQEKEQSIRNKNKNHITAAEPVANTDTQGARKAILDYLKSEWYQPGKNETYKQLSSKATTSQPGPFTSREVAFLNKLGKIEYAPMGAVIHDDGNTYRVRTTSNHGWLFIENTANGTIAVSLEEIPPETTGVSTATFRNGESHMGPIDVENEKITFDQNVQIIMLPNTTNIPSGFGNNLATLKAVFLPNVEKIGASFINCVQLRKVSLNERKLKVISKHAFKNCPVEFPTSNQSKIQNV